MIINLIVDLLYYAVDPRMARGTGRRENIKEGADMSDNAARDPSPPQDPVAVPRTRRISTQGLGSDIAYCLPNRLRWPSFRA